MAASCHVATREVRGRQGLNFELFSRTGSYETNDILMKWFIDMLYQMTT